MMHTDFVRFVELFRQEIFLRAPKDTWNLARNALRVEWVGPDEARIYIDQDIAPYMPYTNEPWVSPRWHGKPNPNEGWWQDCIELAKTILVRYFGAKEAGKERISAKKV